MRYFFILGQSPKLSLLEIYTVLNAQGVDFTIEKFSPEVALIDSAAKLDAESLLDSLGGTIKIGKIFKSVKRLTLTARLVADWLASQKLRETKFHFGFSTYRLNDPPFTLHHRFGLEVKKILQQKNISARLVVSREPNLSSVTVAKTACSNTAPKSA
ncbi:hypothetical protein HY933_04445 [Candidatus Falkowbacteria bacterium]|nr:hypothetical protein [Candidatus Falkowbacteria bacterium]